MFRLLFVIFLIVPIVEIYVLIEVGSRVGALTTVALVVFTAVLGAALMRQQGFATLQRVQREVASGELPALTLMEGAFILVAGALLLTPGFVTDAIGFSFLVPPWRRTLTGLLAGKILTVGRAQAFHGTPGASTANRGFSRTPGGTVIDGEFTEKGDQREGAAGKARGRLEPPE